MREILETLCGGRDLGRQDTRRLFGRIVAGELSDTELAAVLVALKSKGETPQEVAGAADALRDSALPIDVNGWRVADTCGTGGDGSGTVNISTAAALVVAAGGVRVAKHGNRSFSSQCGSADVLERCGVRIDGDAEFARTCLDELGICFLFAPRYHPGVRHAMQVRKTLGMRTIFNLLGPLANPARPAFQVMGVYDPSACLPMARTLGALGCEAALVVHGAGLDEIAVHDKTQAALLRQGSVTPVELSPEQAGLQRYPVEALKGGGPEENAVWLREVLAGRGTAAQKSSVAMNAGALLWLAGKAPAFWDGVQSALQILQSGAAAAILERWTELSHGVG